MTILDSLLKGYDLDGYVNRTFSSLHQYTISKDNIKNSNIKLYMA